MKSGEWILAVWVGVLVSCVVMLIAGRAPTATEWIAGVKDVATAFGLVAAAYVGVRGLSTWERQLKGNAEFERARALALVTYRVRDQVAHIRAPFLMAYEFPENYADTRHATRRQRAEARGHVYRKRWEPAFPILQEFDVCALEAEALWGPEVRVRADALRQLLRKLKVSTESDLDEEAYDGPRTAESAKFRRELSPVISDTGAGNSFSAEIASAISGIDDLIKPHLRWRG